LGKLRVLSGDEVCRILEHHGFMSVRQKGSHRIFKNVRVRELFPFPCPCITQSAAELS